MYGYKTVPHWTTLRIMEAWELNDWQFERYGTSCFILSKRINRCIIWWQ